MGDADIPEVRVRQPAFSTVTRRAGLTSYDSMMEMFDTDLDEVSTAVQGGPVSPGFVASVLMTFPRYQFRELFQLDIYPSST